jgi:glycerol kinase
MSGSYILALDQGTTGTTALVFDAQGRVQGRGYAEIQQFYPQPGWVEHDPLDIWSSVASTARLALAHAGIQPAAIAAVGMTNQRETTIVWDRATGEPVHRAIVWQCRRSAGICNELRAAGRADLFRARTGLVLDAYFSGTKLTWLFRQNPALRARAERGELAFGTVDTWLIWKLTGGATHLTDYTNASRTLLYDIEARQWDEDLCELLEVPARILPAVQLSASTFGEISAMEFPCRGIPIAGLAGDQQAALFGQGCVNPGDTKNTYGTGCFLMTNAGRKRHPSTHGLLETLAVGADLSPCYALEGSVFIAGALIQWLRDGLQILDHAAQSEEVALRASVDHGVHVVPAFVGLGAPYWDMEARGAITGLTRGSGRAEIVRAALEAIAFQTRDLVHAMEADAGHSLQDLRVDGGATANNFLMQFQADLLGIAVDRPAVAETTAAGAAFLAGLNIGLYEGIEALGRLRRSERVFQPSISRQRANELYRGWQGAVARVRLRP